MSENTRICPYCGEEISNDDIKCPHCGTRFEFSKNKPSSEASKVFESSLGKAKDDNQVNPDENGDLPYFKKIGTPLFIVLIVVTLGIYGFYWIIKNTKTFNKIASESDKINIIFPVLYVVSSVIYQFAYISQNNSFAGLMVIPMWTFLFITIYKMLRVIENYAYKTTGKVFKHNGFCWWFFNLVYINFAINTYSERVRNAK